MTLTDLHALEAGLMAGAIGQSVEVRAEHFCFEQYLQLQFSKSLHLLHLLPLIRGRRSPLARASAAVNHNHANYQRRLDFIRHQLPYSPRFDLEVGNKSFQLSEA